MVSLSSFVLAIMMANQPEVPECVKRIHGMETYREIDRQFPGSLEIRDSGCKVIEFCPDNTCDAFVAQKGGSPEQLMEFAYLYVYFFSEYFVLAEWRVQGDANAVAARILAASRYKGCGEGRDSSKAQCVLRRVAKERQVVIADVRYDEGTRQATPKKLP